MSGLEVTGLVVGLGAFVTSYLHRNTKNYVLKDAVYPSFQYRKARVGYYPAILSYFWLVSYIVDLEAVRKTHLNINTWKDEELLAWKNSHVTGSSAIAVAAAIFASVGLSALSLPNIDVVHWSARACLSASMALGILAVIFASYQQQAVGMMNNPLEIRLWLSCGMADQTSDSKTSQDSKTDEQKTPQPPSLQRSPPLQKSQITKQASTREKSRQNFMPSRPNYPPPYSMYPLESSIAAQMMIKLPSMLLQQAILLYLTGFGLYLLFAWLEDSIPPSHDYKYTFIFYITAVGFALSYFFAISVFNALDQQKGEEDFSLNSEELKKPESQLELQQWLGLIQGIKDWTEEPKRPDSQLELQQLFGLIQGIKGWITELSAQEPSIQKLSTRELSTPKLSAPKRSAPQRSASQLSEPGPSEPGLSAMEDVMDGKDVVASYSTLEAELIELKGKWAENRQRQETAIKSQKAREQDIAPSLIRRATSGFKDLIRPQQQPTRTGDKDDPEKGGSAQKSYKKPHLQVKPFMSGARQENNDGP